MNVLGVFGCCLAGVLGTSGFGYYVTSTWPLYESGVQISDKDVSLARRWEAADRIALFPYLIVVSILALASSWPAFGTFEERWFGTTEANRWCMVLYCTKTGFDMVAQLLTLGDANSKRIEMLAHHAISTAAIAHGIHSGYCGFFASLAIISEISTIFLNAVMSIKLFTGERTKTQRFLVAVNGLLLWLSYITCRLLVFPFWLWLFLTDAAAHDVSAVSPIQLVMYPLSTASMLVLSLYWFLLITRGLQKALSSKSSGKRH